MKTNERSGVDLQIALSSFADALAQVPVRANDAAPSAAAVDAPTTATAPVAPITPAAASAQPLQSHWKAVLKQWARPIARAAYRLVKPLARPIVFRLRAYMTEPIRLELQRTQQLLDSGIDAALQSVLHHQHAQQQQLRAHLQELHAQQLQQLNHQSLVSAVSTVQEIQAARDALKRHIAAFSSHDAQFERLGSQLNLIEQYGAAAARRIAVPAGGGDLLVRTQVGYVLCPSSDHALLSLLLEAGDLEAGTRVLIQSLLRPGDTFVDVGANIGMHTLAAAFALQGQGRIVAFEPFGPTHELLRKTLWLNGFSGIVETHQAAASDRSGRQTLFLGGTSGHHSLYELAPTLAPAIDPIEVALVRIDEVLQGAAKVDLMKIDVEGAELEVLAGAKRTVTANPEIALIVEFDSAHIRRSSQSTDGWVRAFERFGLEFGVIHPDLGRLEHWTKEQIEHAGTVNLFFARPDSQVWKRAWGKQ
jgi:FkbM family methyltransferase